MTEQELDEAVDKLSGAITMLTARVDHRLLLMALFKLFANTVIQIEDPKFLSALADDFTKMANDLNQRAGSGTTLN